MIRGGLTTAYKRTVSDKELAKQTNKNIEHFENH